MTHQITSPMDGHQPSQQMLSACSGHETTSGAYRHIFPSLASPSATSAVRTQQDSIKAQSGSAEVAMGNSLSAGGSKGAPSSSAIRSNVHQGINCALPQSNLSALLSQQDDRDLNLLSKENESGQGNQLSSFPESHDEADSASEPPLFFASGSAPPEIPRPDSASRKPNSSLDPPVRTGPIAYTIGACGNAWGEIEHDVRRCYSSKEMVTLAPPSGSPYLDMLQKRGHLELAMRERLLASRESVTRSDLPRSPSGNSDDSTNSSRRSRLSNETRNRRRAEHNRAVINDLCEIVADLFVAEAKLIKPTQYGVESNSQRENVLKSVRRFVSALPSRYALGVETPSEVLVHMRLMAAARGDHSRVVVHVSNLEDDNKWTSWGRQPTDQRCLRLVTISCYDSTGLLEYISKLLATGGSRVLDADVMLSNDNIVLDRFVVEMNGKLRLDKFAESIEAFLSEVATNGEQQSTHNSPSQNSPPPGPLYVHPTSRTTEMDAPHVLQEEIEAAVPLSRILASPHSTEKLSPCFPIPPIPKIRRLRSMPESNSVSSNNPQAGSTHPMGGAACPSSNERKQAGDVDSREARQKRPLINRKAYPDLDQIDTEKELYMDYVTVGTEDAVGGFENEIRDVPIIPFDQLVLIETIGMGRVSTIYRAAWQHNAPPAWSAPVNVQMVALKVAMVNPDTGDTTNVDEVRREADIAARLQHPNICDIVGVAADDECFCLAYEYCEGGSLFSLLADPSRYYEYLPIALDIANGMAFLHSRNIIHRDLKPSNILLTRDHRAKISDFGMSVANTGQELTAETGTYRYMAPEVIRHESYSSNADVYSFGICLWQLITREAPFATMTPIQAAFAVAEGRRPEIPPSTPQRLREIITSCWNQDSHKRPSFTYIALALADYAREAFSPANVGAQTLQIANEMLANVEGNSNVNVDFTAAVMSPYIQDDGVSMGSNVGLEI